MLKRLSTTAEDKWPIGAAMQVLYAEEERWPGIAGGFVLFREPDGSGPRFNIWFTYCISITARNKGRGRGKGWVHTHTRNSYQSTIFSNRAAFSCLQDYINRSQKHECRNWERGRTVSFPGIFVSNFRYSVFAVHNTRLILYSETHRVSRVLSFFSSRRNCDSSNPSPAGSCAPLFLLVMGGRGTLAGERGDGRVPIPTRYSLYLCTLWWDLWQKCGERR